MKDKSALLPGVSGRCYWPPPQIPESTGFSLCIFVGHSFGGLILERAICQALLGSILRKKNEAVNSPADLVVLLNPAVDAIGTRQFIDVLKRNKVKVKMGEKLEETKHELPFPLLVSITSEGDLATKMAFPFGQFFVGAFKWFRKYDPCSPGLPSQRYLHSHTAGHVPYFHNFQVRRVPKENETGLWWFESDDNSQKYKILPNGNGHNHSSYWLLQVPKEIIPDHSNIFTPACRNMLISLLDWTITSVETTKLEVSTPGQTDEGPDELE